jgi:hypothetical protein
MAVPVGGCLISGASDSEERPGSALASWRDERADVRMSMHLALDAA